MRLAKILAINVGLLSLLMACNRPTIKPKPNGDFTTDVIIKTTPVKTEGSKDLSWMYAMLATIESEHIIMGDSINLSVDYIARMLLTDETAKCYLSNGKQAIDLSGMPPLLLRLIDIYGAMPHDSYHSTGKINYDVLCRRLTLIAKSSRNLTDLNIETGSIIDHTIDYLPKSIYMYGAQYTPMEFGHSIYQTGEYVSLTSFTHHPFNQKFAIEIPENKAYDTSLNLPIDTFMAHIETALRSGHPVCWEGDISGSGFSFANGTATLNNNGVVTQEERQKQFESRHIVNDYCMELIGMAHDKRGQKYFIAKSSWGANNPYKGLMYLSQSYVRLKTIVVYMSQNAFNK